MPRFTFTGTLSDFFFLMGSFWDKTRDFNFDLKWLFKVRNYFEKLERESCRKQNVKTKKLFKKR